MDIKKDFSTYASDLETFIDNSEIITSISKLKGFIKSEKEVFSGFIDRVVSLSLSISDLAICLKHLGKATLSNKEKEVRYFVRITAVHSWQILDENGNLLGKDVN